MGWTYPLASKHRTNIQVITSQILESESDLKVNNVWFTILALKYRHEKTREHASSARGNFFKLRKLFTNITAII